MELRQLGGSGLSLSVLGFGTMTFGGSGYFSAVGQTRLPEAQRLIGLCMDAGVNFFDTANVYSDGLSEEILGQSLSKRSDVLIATKASLRMGTGPNDLGNSRSHLIASCEASLRRLQTDYIDLFQLHSFDELTAVDETLRALDDLIRAGKVRYAGCSNFGGWQLMKALATSEACGLTRMVSHQICYSLTSREAEHELIPLGIDQRVGTIVWGPLSFGLLAGKSMEGAATQEDRRLSKWSAPGQIDRLKLDTILTALGEIAKERASTPSQVAISYLVRKTGVTTVLIGARNETQLRENLNACACSLSAEDMARLDAASSIPLPYPYWQQAIHARERNPYYSRLLKRR